MAKSDYLKDKVINIVLRGTAWTPPANLYVSLHTADPGGTGSNEITGNAYARVAATFAAPSAGTGATSNAAVVDFPVATPAGQGTATHFGVWDTLTTGNLLYTGALAVSKTIAANNFLRFAAGELDITED